MTNHTYNEEKLLNELYSFIVTLKEHTRFTDYKKLKIKDENLSGENTEIDFKCHFNMDKKSLAHLMRILLEGNLIVFDEKNERRNALQMKRFVEKYFTYQNSSKDRVAIKSFNREYSETASFHEDEKPKRNQFIDDLIFLLEQKKIKYKED